MQLTFNNIPIANLSDWGKSFIKKDSEKHWKDGYSAKEFAKRVLDGSFEKDASKVFSLFLQIQFVSAEIEKISYLDSFKGGQRNHDLACLAESNGEKIAVCVEAKVSEDFGNTLALNFASLDLDKNKNKVQRINNLCKIFFGKSYDESLSNVYYQILTGLYGTVKYAKEINAKKSVFVIYQMNTQEEKSQSASKEHLKDINDFLKLSGNPIFENANAMLKLKSYDEIETFIAFVEAEK